MALVPVSTSLVPPPTVSPTEAGRVHLEGVAVGAVTGSVGVDTETHGLAASGADSLDDATVTGNELGSQKGGREDDGLERHLG